MRSILGHAGPFAARIACGATADSIEPGTGFVWSKDFGYSGGSAAPLNTTSRIAPQLNALRYFQVSDGPENCYNITVPSGHYTIRYKSFSTQNSTPSIHCLVGLRSALCPTPLQFFTNFYTNFHQVCTNFARISLFCGNINRFYFAYGQQDNQGREPYFEVSLEGTIVYTYLQGWSAIADNAYADSMLHVTDGAATVCLHNAGHGNPAVASVEILQLYVDAYNMGPSQNLNVVMRTLERVTAGAAQSGYGARMNADPWGGDRYWATDQTLFAPGNAPQVLRTSQNITNYSTPPNIYPEQIYQSATTTSPKNKLSYTIAVQPGQNYSIWLHFAEIQPGYTMPGQRVFDILANNVPIFQTVDIVAMAGAQFKALILNTTVLVTGATLTISFFPVVGSVVVNAFEIFQIIPRQYATANKIGKPNAALEP